MDLKERRASLGLTQDEAAAACGFDGSSIAAYERGYYAPRAKRAEALARLFNCSVEDVYKSAEESRVKCSKASGTITEILKLLPDASEERQKAVLELLSQS